jgi:hypothetical protein
VPDRKLKFLQIVSVAAAAFRLAIGWLWLKLFLILPSDATPDQRLRTAWRNAQRLSFLFKGAELYRNEFGRGWREFLLARLLWELERHGCAIVPEFVTHGLELLVSNASNATIVVTTHSPVDAILNRVCRENGISSSLLAGNSMRVRGRARRLGLEGELDTIARTSDALLVMRRKLGEGRMILSCIDFTRSRPDSYHVDLLVSPVLFELARKLAAAVLYADAWVSPDGKIQVTYALPRVDLATASADAMAHDFIAWLQNAQGDKRPMGVSKWQGKRVKRKDRLRLPLAIARPDP